MRQFFLEVPTGRAPAPGDRYVLTPEESHHLLDVLRGRERSDWCLVDGRGRRLTARVTGKTGRSAHLEILTVTADQSEAEPPRLTLACAVVKGRRFEWALEKAVELGAHRIIPLLAARGVIDPGAGRQERWQALLKAALKQAGRCILPSIAAPASVADALSQVGGSGVFWGALPDEATEGRAGLADLGSSPPSLPDELALFVGPEGGWSAGELHALRAARATALDLGPHVLRTETAAVAGLAVLQQLRLSWRRAVRCGGGGAGSRPPSAPPT